MTFGAADWKIQIKICEATKMAVIFPQADLRSQNKSLGIGIGKFDLREFGLS